MNQEDEHGVRVVLSAPQLAAILTQDSIPEAAMQSNRLWGGLRVAAGVVELLGAGVLRSAPVPALASPVGSVAFGVHSADLAANESLVAPAEPSPLSTAALALTLGSNERRRDHVGLAVDIAAPFALSGRVSAARVASIRAGRINLLMHEAQAGSQASGHTIFEHVDRSEAELHARLAAEPDLCIAACFSTLDEAERVLSGVLRVNGQRIIAWSVAAAAGGGGQQVLTPHSFSRVIGHGVVRETHTLRSLTRVQVVLRLQIFNQQPYYVVTARPMP